MKYVYDRYPKDIVSYKKRSKLRIIKQEPPQFVNSHAYNQAVLDRDFLLRDDPHDEFDSDFEMLDNF